AEHPHLQALCLHNITFSAAPSAWARQIRSLYLASRTRGLILLVLVLVGCQEGPREPADAEDGPASDIPNAVTISYRQFSGSPSLGGGDKVTDPRDPAYGALSIFIENAESRTRVLGGGK